MSCEKVVPCPEKIKEIIESENTACTRISWSYHIFASNYKLHAQKRINVWTRHDFADYPLWKQQCGLVCDLDWAAYHLVDGQIEPLNLNSSDSHKLQIVDDSIVFNGGFLVFDDPGIQQPLAESGLLLDTRLASVFDSPCPDYAYVPEDEAEEAAGLPDIEERLSNPLLQLLLKETRLSDEKRLELAMTADEVDRVVPAVPFGRNIHIEVEFEEDRPPAKQKRPIMHPLFFFPQGTGPAALDELMGEKYLADLQAFGAVFLAIGNRRAPDGAFRLHWAISNQPIVSYPFEFADTKLMHTVTVSQDSDWMTKLFAEQDASDNDGNGQEEISTGPYFEMMVDSIGLGSDARQYLTARRFVPQSESVTASAIMDRVGNHIFDQRERKFFVGFAPSKPDPGSEEWENQLYRGRIRRIFFDPNSSCSSC